MTTVKVLHTISGIDPRNGGPTNALIGLAAAQRRAAGLDVRVIATWQERDAFRSADVLEARGVGVRMVGPARGKLSRHPALEEELTAEVKQCDVVHVHAMWEEMQYRACRVATKLAKPYVFTPHGMLDPWNMTRNRLAKGLVLAVRMRKSLERAALLHFTTEIERQWVARMSLSPRTIVEPLGLDMAEFANLPAKGTFRARYPQVGDRPIVLFLGRIHPGKGVELLVPALAQMKRSDAVLVVAGPDADGYGATIRELMAQHAVAPQRMIFTGMIGGEEKLAALVDADLLALPSYHENFGLVVIEALAAGTPVVISDQVNLHSDITAAGLGGVVPTDPAALARELDRWLSDDALRNAAAAKAPAFVRERYDWDQIARRWAEHYRSVVR